MRLPENSVAVITGAASGIGRALTFHLARAGAALALADVDERGLHETAAGASEAGISVTTHMVDVSDAHRMEEFAREVVEQHGRATHLINNAGVALLGNVEEISIADIEWLMGINFWGVVYGCKFFLPILRRQPRAHIVNLSSVFGLFAPAGHSAYAASKFAVRGFTESLRHELEGTNVFVTAVHPGGISTRIAASARIGAATTSVEHSAETERFERLARTTAEVAAERIVNGMLRGRPRVLVGADAHLIELFQRLLPVRHWGIIKWQMERRAGGRT